MPVEDRSFTPGWCWPQRAVLEWLARVMEAPERRATAHGDVGDPAKLWRMKSLGEMLLSLRGPLCKAKASDGERSITLKEVAPGHGELKALPIDGKH